AMETNMFDLINVVIGSAYQKKDELTNYVTGQSNICLYHSIDEEKMAELMSVSETAIVPASGVLLEALSAGCNIISGSYVDNQMHLYAQYKEINAFIDAGDFSRESLTQALAIVKSGRFKQTRELIDGSSNTRIL